MIHTSILQEMNSPTLERVIQIDKGGKLYPTLTNRDGSVFALVVKYWMTGPESFDHTYEVIGKCSVPVNFLEEMVEEIIQKELL